MMATVDPPAPLDEAALLEAHLQRLAGHLLPLAPGHAFLELLTHRLLGDAAKDPDTLRARLAEEDQRLEQHLVTLAARSPFGRLIEHHHLSRLESDLLLFALLPELDDRFGDVFLALRGGTLPRRPTLGIALRALLVDRAERWQARHHLAGSALWEAGLLRRDAEDRPGLDTLLIPSAPVVAAAHGHLPERLDGGVEIALIGANVAETEIRPALAALVADLARWFETVQSGVIHLVAEAPDDARQVASTLARAFGRPLLRITGLDAKDDAALREAALAGVAASAVLLLEVERGVDALRVPGAWKPPGLAIVSSPPGCAVHLPPALQARRIDISRPRPAEQAATWRSALDAVNGSAEVNLLASRTYLTTSEIRKVATLAALRANIAGRVAPVHEDVLGALAEAVPDPVSSLARTTRPKVAWSRLVLERDTKSRLEELIVRVQHRVTVEDTWGMAGAEGRGDGLIALFHGESGTGKTLGAEAVAARLGLPMLRIDLSRVVSKYIGETEKHLGSLFDAAEGFRTVLFFDEADALFGSRTGVKDAHDRYANIETNYLLYRLEAFEGTALLSTNLMQNLDSAFTRRLQFIIHFPRPSAPLQRQIWSQHLPREQLAPGVDLDALVQKQDLVGGEIRNAALSAAYAAAAAGSAISQAMLDQAVRAERIKRGKAVRRE
jgi:hypothetical protein